MIRVDGAGLAPAESYALAVLVDLARLVPVDDPDADVVLLAADARPVTDASLRGCVDARWHLQVGDGRVTIPRSVLRTITDAVGAGAEQRTEARDRHERVPSSENPLVAAGCEREPVISRAALLLRAATVRAAGRRMLKLAAPWPEGRRWAVALTHDLDAVRWWPLFSALRIAELARKGEWSTLARAVGASVAAVAGDPIRDGVDGCLAAERARDVRATWYVLCGTPTIATMRAGDLTYVPESPAARAILESVSGAGHEIGLHGSFETMTDAERFAAQRGRLAEIVGREVVGVRQHYLRMRPGATQRAMEGAGFAYDATAGFPDRNGFRLGVADVVPTWDARAQAATPLEQVPLIWMDRALSKYQRVEDPSAWIDHAVRLANACRAVEGLWVGLWHPNLTPPLGFPGAPAAYARLIGELSQRAPWTATMREIVAWRRARRAVRVRRVSPDGRTVELTNERGAPPVSFEDAPRE